MKTLSMWLGVSLLWTACAVDGGSTETIAVLPDPETGKSDDLGARKIRWSSASGRDVVVTPSVGLVDSGLGILSSLWYYHEGEATVDEVSDTEIHVHSDRIVIPVREQHWGEHWMSPRGLVGSFTDRIGFVLQYRLPGTTEWKPVHLNEPLGGPRQRDYAVLRRSRLDFWGLKHDSLRTATVISGEDISSNSERTYLGTARFPDLTDITGFDLALIPVPYRTLGDLAGDYKFGYSGSVYCDDEICGDFVSGETPPLSNAGSQAACEAHSDCPADERCECHSSGMEQDCMCLTGEPGETPFLGECEWGVDCASAICGVFTTQERFCTRTCTTDADCGGELPFCDDDAVYSERGPVCGRRESRILLK